MAGTPSSGALTLRAGEPFVAHFTLHDNLGVPQSLAGRTFSLAVVKVGATSSFMDAEATLSGDNLYAILSFTGDQTAAAFVEFGARIVTYALLEQIDDAQVTRATNSLTVQASTAEPSASDPVIIDIPYVNAFVSPQGFVVATTGSDSTTAKAATAGDRVQTDLDVIATGEIRDETAGIRDATQAIADIVATDAATVAGDRDTTEGYRDEALASANLAADALASILMSANRYPDYATGFAATTSGQYFLVMAPDANTFAVLYRNPSATPLTSFPSASALAAAILALNSRTVDSRILRSIADLHQSGKGYVAKSDIASVPEAIAGLISGKWIDPVALKASIEAAIASLGTRSPDPRILRAIADLRRAQANVAEAATPPVSPSALGRILYPVHRELLDLLERVESLEASGGGGAGAGLPSFPTPRMAIVGNSLTRQNDSNDTNDKRNIGYSYWAMLRCGYRVASPGTLNFGVNGERSDEILARYSAVLAAEPGVIVLHSITTNDVKYPGLTKEQSLANVTSMVDQALAAYIPVIITTDVPRGNAAFPSQRYNSDQQAKSNWLRRQVMLLGARQGVTVIDGYRLTVDPASTTADAIANTKSDGLHSLHLEAKRYGDLIGDALAQIFPPWPRLPATNTDLYDATSNVNGCLTPNPMLMGATLATGWAERVPAGVTSVTTKVTIDGVEYQRVSLSGTPSGATPAYDIYALAASPSLIAGGDYLEAVANINVEAGATGYLSAGLRQQITYSSGSAFRWCGENPAGFSPAIPEAWGGVHVTMPLNVTSTPTAAELQIRIQLIQGTAVNLAFFFNAASLRKVES